MVLLVWHTIRQYNLPCTNLYILNSLLIVSISNELQPHLCNLLAHSMANKNISAAVFAGTRRVKRLVVNNESDKHNAVKSKQLCWYHRKFGDKRRFCNGYPAPDIIRAYLKVEQRSRETQRAIRNWRRHWFARRNEKATPLRSGLFGRLWLCHIGSTCNKRGKVKPQSHRVLSL